MRVTAAHAVGDDVDSVAMVQEIQSGLGDADMRLDADDGNVVRIALGRADGRRWEMLGDLGHPHREGGLVDVFDRLARRIRRRCRRALQVWHELRTGWAQLLTVLRGGIDRDVEYLACVEHRSESFIGDEGPLDANR